MKLGGKALALAGFMLLVMGGEAAVLYVMLAPAGSAGGQSSAGATEGGDGFDREAIDADRNTVEVPISAFNCTNTSADSIIHISFQLVAVVAKEQQIAFDETANVAHKARVKQAVSKVVRSSSLEDLNDPSLSTMKRLIREEINKILRKSYVIEVVISDFRIMEQ